MNEPRRCAWCNLKNPLYVTYHDREWGQLRLDDAYLFEMLVLESFQAGLSWECVLNKREDFRRAYDGFDPMIISTYGDDTLQSLLTDPTLIRNGRKARATVSNSRVFLAIAQEYGSFSRYLKSFTGEEILYETGKTKSPLSEAISRDLYARGMRFVGPTVIYSYLQAIGLIHSHDPDCYLYRAARTTTPKEQ